MNGQTNVTQLTAPGRGAVAVMMLNITGPESSDRFDSCFQAANGMMPSQAAIGRILYGVWDSEDVVVVRVSDNDWEIHCHGGDAAVERISRQLTSTDRPSDPALKVGPDKATEGRLERAILEQLLKCRTRRTASILLAQYNGALRRYLTTLSIQEDADKTAALLHNCLRWHAFSAHLTNPWRVAVIGQPNAGKSALMNAIIGYERSIVFDQPGTTRDLIEVEVVLGGWPFLLSDTAGIREETSNNIEAAGVESARNCVANCDACLLVIDSQNGWTDTDAQLLSAVPPACPTAILWNKTDLSLNAPAPSLDLRAAAKIVETSAIDGAGIEDIVAWLPAAMVPTTPEATAALPVVDLLAAQLTALADNSSGVSLREILDEWL
ncbi:MAG: GTP-binding protein [Fuerstiella sp.]|nr:GTP-binding protein [Fuerstiella sp.]MCP4855897.1 GTP-binding protein [Fuerstiella sp.]